MQDYNFFSEYVFVKSNVPVKKLILLFMYVLLFIGLGAAYLSMRERIDELQVISDQNETLIGSTAFKSAYQDSQDVKREAELLSALYEESQLFTMMLPKRFPVTDELMTTILEAIPRNVSFNTFNVTEQSVDVTAQSTDYSYIAELQYNLRSLGIFNHVFVKIISNSEDIYTFTINMEFGGDVVE